MDTFVSSFGNGTKLEAGMTDKKLDDVLMEPLPTSAHRVVGWWGEWVGHPAKSAGREAVASGAPGPVEQGHKSRFESSAVVGTTRWGKEGRA